MQAGRARGRPPGGGEPGNGDAETPARPGDQVAHYQIVGEVGRGGMGVIFRARDTKLHREVALKCPWPSLAADPTVRERFLREAQAASQLSHQHVVPIYEILEWEGLPWIAMELVKGQSLRAWLRDKGPLPLRTALACAEGLADALRSAHGQGIIHRDINPNNILIRADGWPLLSDFGLAHVFEVAGPDTSATTESEPLTAPGHVLGTAGYMSPEQVLGKPVDPRSDVFSFGTVLYEMCTGRRAFERDEAMGANEAILTRDPPPVSAIDPSLPRELDRIVRKALAKRPADRHQDALELYAEIAALRRQVESADYTPLPALRPALAPRHAAWAVLALVALVAASAPWWRGLLPRPSTLAAGTPRQVTSDAGCETQPMVSPDGGLIAYTSLAPGRSDIWISDVKGGSRLRLTDDGAHNHGPAWFPEGATLAFVSDRGGETSVWKVPRLGGAPVLVVANADDPAFSPDGKRIVFSRPNASGHYRIAVAPLEEPSRAEWLTGDADGERDHRESSWSPDGRTICYSDTRNLWLVSAEGGRAHRLTGDNAVDRDPTWSSDGRSVIFASEREGTHALWRVSAAGDPVERLTFGTGPEGDPSVSSDGSRIVYSTYSSDYDVVVADLGTGRKELVQSRLYDASPSLAPDASAVVFASTRRGGRYDLWLQPLVDARPAGPPRQLTDLPGTVNMTAWSPDGKWIAFRREQPDRREIWVVPASGGAAERFSDGRGKDIHPAWSPDGSRLAYASEQGGESHIWTAPAINGRRAGPGAQITFGASIDYGPAWTIDGQRIAYVRSTSQDRGVWMVPAAGGAPSGPLVKGADIGRLHWEKGSPWLWVSSVGPAGETRLMKVSTDGKEVPAVPPELFAEAAPPGEFDLSADGRVLAFTRQQVRGDIWLLESRRGAY